MSKQLATKQFIYAKFRYSLMLFICDEISMWNINWREVGRRTSMCLRVYVMLPDIYTHARPRSHTYSGIQFFFFLTNVSVVATQNLEDLIVKDEVKARMRI